MVNIYIYIYIKQVKKNPNLSIVHFAPFFHTVTHTHATLSLSHKHSLSHPNSLFPSATCSLPYLPHLSRTSPCVTAICTILTQQYNFIVVIINKLGWPCFELETFLIYLYLRFDLVIWNECRPFTHMI